MNESIINNDNITECSGQNRKPWTEIGRLVAWTIFSGLTLPVIATFAWYQLRDLGLSHVLSADMAYGLGMILPIVFCASIVRQVFRDEGIAVSVLSWPRTICDQIQRALGRVQWVVCPFLMECEIFKRYSAGRYSDSLGRMALIAAMIVLGVACWRTASALVRYESNRDRRRPTYWLTGGRVLQWLVTLAPFLLGGLSAIGYRFAAEQLGQRILWGLLVGVSVLVIWSLLLHLFKLFQLRIRRGLEGSDSKSRQLLEELKNNVRQVEKLINVGGLASLAIVQYQIWHSAIPLGRLFSQFRLWDGNQLANGVVESITVQHLILASAVMYVSLTISRNLSGMIELTLPERLPLDKGGRFAITFIARYVVGLIGLVEAASILGFSWDRVQWLAAGLTVGLGFGLQEVFANLVSGIIILIERPVRVGDSVSVNQVSGTVSKVALRATTIIDSDRREWIVPNKKFITDDVMNWTLSDTISRAVFPISVAAGSNTRLVHQILLDIAKQQPQVLDFPEPSAVLVKIGQSSLDFELRVYLANRSSFSNLQNELHFQLDEALRSSGVDMSSNSKGFPRVGVAEGTSTDVQRKAA